MHTHPLGSAPAPRDGSGGAKLLLLFPWLRSLKMCKMHVCTSEPPAAWKHTWLHREKGKIASGNVLNVRRVENLGRVGEPVWDGHCSLKKGQNGPGKFRGQICVHVGQTREKLHWFAAAVNREWALEQGINVCVHLAPMSWLAEAHMFITQTDFMDKLLQRVPLFFLEVCC